MSYLLAFIFTYRGVLLPLGLIPAAVLAWDSLGLVQYSVGILLVVLGVVFRLSGVRRIGGRARVHSAGTRDLLTSGIYGHVRNPLYVGNILYAGGLVALFFSLPSAGLAIAYLLGLYTLIALHEEKALESLLGPPYRQYLSDVPRWFFRLRPYKDPAAVDSVVPFKEIFLRERFFLINGMIICGIATLIFSRVLHFSG
ncbi:MAG: isoprenylcysteine carboxylmethyltransferase family protein, partial [Planctomycetota bacterium]